MLPPVWPTSEERTNDRVPPYRHRSPRRAQPRPQRRTRVRQGRRRHQQHRRQLEPRVRGPRARPGARQRLGPLPDYAGAFVQPDGSTLFGNITTGACLVAKVSPSGALSIYAVYVPKGWTYSIKSSDPGKLLVEIPDPFTGVTHSIMVEPGKTRIR
jgi:hypothetical protein